MVGLVFAIAASANFPVLLLSIAWPGLTTRGAVAGSAAGLISAVGLATLGPGIWTATLGLGAAPFPLRQSATAAGGWRRRGISRFPACGRSGPDQGPLPIGIPVAAKP
jgi:hypothetical protein